MPSPFDNEALRQTLIDLNHAEEAGSLDERHAELVSWQIAERVLGNPEDISEERRLHNNITILKQGLLHRSAKLIEAASAMLVANNCHGLALVCRGHVEGTAQLGYFCDRLDALGKGNIDFDAFHERLALTLLGAAHEQFRNAPKPLNIMTCIEKSDRHLKRMAMGDRDQKGMLLDIYGWLSEFCHPNFLSSASAFLINRKTQTMIFRHNDRLTEQDAQILPYLTISAGIFSIFYRSFLDLERHLPADGNR